MLVIEFPSTERQEIIFNALHVTYGNSSAELKEQYLTLTFIAQLFIFGVKYNIYTVQYLCKNYYTFDATKGPWKRGDLRGAIVELYTSEQGDRHKMRFWVSILVVGKRGELGAEDRREVQGLMKRFPEVETYCTNEIERYREYLRLRSIRRSIEFFPWSSSEEDSEDDDDKEEEEEKEEERRREKERERG